MAREKSLLEQALADEIASDFFDFAIREDLREALRFASPEHMQVLAVFYLGVHRSTGPRVHGPPNPRLGYQSLFLKGPRDHGTTGPRASKTEAGGPKPSPKNSKGTTGPRDHEP